MTNAASITSDFDYLKIVDDDTLLITTTAAGDPDFQFPTDPFGGFGFGEQGIVTIDHNLNSIPMVRAFIDPGANGLWYSSFASIGYIPIEPNLLTAVTLNQLKLCVNNLSGHSANIPVFYRIYSLSDVGVDSDSRIDKIFKKSDPGLSGVVPATAFSSDITQTVLEINHNANEPILWTMQFSADQNNWYDDGNFIYGPPDTGSGPPGGPYAYYYYHRAYMACDNNKCYIRLESNYPTDQTIYVRFTLDYRS